MNNGQWTHGAKSEGGPKNSRYPSCMETILTYLLIIFPDAMIVPFGVRRSGSKYVLVQSRQVTIKDILTGMALRASTLKSSLPWNQGQFRIAVSRR